jgi:DNA-binding NarL/FixJ family response regulator
MDNVTMKRKILISYPLDDSGVEKIREQTPDLYATQNGEEVLAMVRDREVDRVSIVFGAYTFSEFEIAQAIHAIDPAIPILILGSEIPQEKVKNEYVTNDAGFFFEAVNVFLNGECVL